MNPLPSKRIRMRHKCPAHDPKNPASESTAPASECHECMKLNNICIICGGRGCYEECLICCAEEEEY